MDGFGLRVTGGYAEFIKKLLADGMLGSVKWFEELR